MTIIPQSQQVRRSARLQSQCPDPNGRDYLANLSSRTREDLEVWIRSTPVHKHLLLWYSICVMQSKRYDISIGWINEGEKGYFYNPYGLEDDLLLLCLAEGDGQVKNESQGLIYKRDEVAPSSMSDASFATYADENVVIMTWTNRELWARTAWRIVQDNCSRGQFFARRIKQSPAACYEIAIDMLCLAFHSIAFRGGDSCWMKLVCGPYALAIS
ncbi:hypothetical protein K431DRAFT_290187 [Polychaeton citri CBS 116435]|uniref:Uncharacterized protein n=1 Tax=Polychaeton citri CBS 116435 TaxID=1314669 RepID=A0A9P4QIU0_9PEZI|nr:hypothetical protein K431DRAFT_290187 [Polychaeton citri CBS 116435]